jgi:mRNA interferase MazF
VTEPVQGEVWWGEAPDQKGRPYLVVSRSEAITVLRTVVVAPVTRTVRGIATEVDLGRPEGLPGDSVASLDNLLPFPKAMLVRRLGALSFDRRPDLCRALRAMADC